ncbi:MAG: biotin/lipoyl-binding protein, partial [Muribaculaceae bacterium]|nr:biotin/lipoyl-binding protein [Muribaculaceae bacterium]
MKITNPSVQKIRQKASPVLDYLHAHLKQIIIIVVVLAVIITLLAIFLKPKAPQAPLPTVEVEDVKVDDVNIYGEYVGHIEPQHFVQIRARVEGYLQSINFVEGTYVKKGQTLFVIDPQLYQANVNKAHAQLNKAKAVAHKAQRDLERIKPLYEQNAAS